MYSGVMNTWTEIGKDTHSLKTTKGFYHVMKHGAKTWSVTLNGRIIGSAKTAEHGKELAEAVATDA